MLKSRDIESQGMNNNTSNNSYDDDLLSGDVYETDAAPVDIEDFSQSNNDRPFDKSAIQRKQTDDTFFTNQTNNNGDNNGNSYGNALSTSNTLSGSTENGGIGSKVRLHAKLLRKREHGAKVTNIELFFDLVFVYASKFQWCQRGRLCCQLERITGF